MSSNSPKQSRSGGDHGYGYGGYGAGSGYGYGYGGYGYGYGGYGYGSKKEGASIQRTLQDYLLILRERIWYIIVVFLVVFASALVYTLNQQKIYEGTVSLRVNRRPETVMSGGQGQVTQTDILSAEELNTLVKVMESGTLISRVASRLTGDDLRQFMQPYETGASSDPIRPEDILAENRRISTQRLSLFIIIQYRHPTPAVAAKVANLFAEEYLAYNAKLAVEASLRVVQELQIRADQQERKVKDLENAVHDYAVKHEALSLNKETNTITESLKQHNILEIQAKTRLKEAEIRSQQVAEWRKEGKDLKDLPFIYSQPLINGLATDVASKKIALVQLQQRYRDKHPSIIEAKSSLDQASQELRKAVENAASSIEADYDNAKRNYAGVKAGLDKAESDSRELERLSVEYSVMVREAATNAAIHQQMIERIQEIKILPAGNQINVVDPAGPPPEDGYVAPSMGVNLGLGVALGLGLGLAFAFFVAYIDDRVKSSFDIESVIGLPLIGIIPQIKKMEQPDKAQIVANNADRQVSEAFLALHSALRLKDESKNAQCILVTSTIPGEGKSFVSSNLALTFAAHGERVLIIDCDLRKPNVHKSFRQENLKGVIDVIAGAHTIDDVVIKQLHPNLDVMTSGGRAKNPTQILNSKKFEIMVSELRKRYDRVIFDTPPLAAVSDALIVLPLVDGSIFSIFFNKVRRKAAQFAAKKLLEANVPVYGAVLNGLNLAVSGYYYAQYYDKSYKDYYVVMSKSEGKTQAQAPVTTPDED